MNDGDWRKVKVRDGEQSYGRGGCRARYVQVAEMNYGKL